MQFLLIAWLLGMLFICVAAVVDHENFLEATNNPAVGGENILVVAFAFALFVAGWPVWVIYMLARGAVKKLVAATR